MKWGKSIFLRGKKKSKAFQYLFFHEYKNREDKMVEI
jgi:hypothetical protein